MRDLQRGGIKAVTSVNFYDAAGITVNSYEMLAGNTLTVNAKALPEDATDTKVTYHNRQAACSRSQSQE
ncbi:MAG: hypothetical protein HFH36_04180 [Lachnospiraceae bacterium]|nr:hypothetical protein [Lachnospiraceae bacterium]